MDFFSLILGKNQGGSSGNFELLTTSAKVYYLTIKRAQAYNILTVPIVTSATGGIKK